MLLMPALFKTDCVKYRRFIEMEYIVACQGLGVSSKACLPHVPSMQTYHTEKYVHTIRFLAS